MPAYGRAGILESWLVDVNARNIQVFREPIAEVGYDYSRVATVDGTLTPVGVPDLTVGVTEVLG